MSVVRKISIEDAAAICKICSQEMGYECAPALVKSKIEKLDLKREAVFVAEEESQLLAAENWAQENGIYLMRLNSGINRKDAHSFYEHLGYVSEKEQKRFVKNLK